MFRRCSKYTTIPIDHEMKTKPMHILVKRLKLSQDKSVEKRRQLAMLAFARDDLYTCSL